jgi:hypothetical protein
MEAISVQNHKHSIKETNNDKNNILAIRERKKELTIFLLFNQPAACFQIQRVKFVLSATKKLKS